MKVDLERVSSEKTPIHDKITGSLSLDYMHEKHDKLINKCKWCSVGYKAFTYFVLQNMD